MCRHREKMTIYRPTTEDSEENSPANTLISCFRPQSCTEVKFCDFSHLLCGTLYGSPNELIDTSSLVLKGSWEDMGSEDSS